MENNIEVNNKLVDKWTINHFVFSFICGWLIGPWTTLIITVAYEPIEVIWLQRLFRKFNIIYGNEGLINSLSDIVFDIVGLLLGYYLLGHFFGVSPWFIW